MKAKNPFFLATFIVVVLILPQCKKDVPIAYTVPEKLYLSYKYGSIDECWYKGILYYSAGESAYDAPTYIYDDRGNKVATCNYFANNVDSICMKMDSCRSIYICEDNIWGWTPIDIYGLSNE